MTLYLEIPNKEYKAINILSSAGNISIDNINAKEINSTSDSGKINFPITE